MSSNAPTATKEEARIAGVIVTHGHLAGELLAAAEMIVGPISFRSWNVLTIWGVCNCWR